MKCNRFGGAIFCGPDSTYTIHVRGKVFCFDWDSYCGPMPIGKRGQSIDVPQYFWSAVTWWAQQGKKVDAAGGCIWQEPTPEFNPDDFVRVGRHLYHKQIMESSPELRAMYERYKRGGK